MKTIIVDKNDLKNIKIETQKDGFALWVVDEKKNKLYWIVDGSEYKNDGTISLGYQGGISGFEKGNYKYCAIYNKELNQIEIVKKLIKKVVSKKQK